MNVVLPQTANDDVVRQFRYYLVFENVRAVAIRFRNAVRLQPLVGPRYHSSHPQFQGLRSWPVAGFEAIRIYYLLDNEAIHVIRVLHGKRDLERLLEGERGV